MIVVVYPSAEDHRSRTQLKLIVILVKSISIRKTKRWIFKLRRTYVPGAHGRSEEQLEITSARSVHGNDGLHVFQIVDGVLGAGAGISLYFQQDRSIARHFPKKEIDTRSSCSSSSLGAAYKRYVCWEKVVRGGGGGGRGGVSNRRCEETLMSARSKVDTIHEEAEIDTTIIPPLFYTVFGLSNRKEKDETFLTLLRLRTPTETESTATLTVFRARSQPRSDTVAVRFSIFSPGPPSRQRPTHRSRKGG